MTVGDEKAVQRENWWFRNTRKGRNYGRMTKEEEDGLIKLFQQKLQERIALRLQLEELEKQKQRGACWLFERLLEAIIFGACVFFILLLFLVGYTLLRTSSGGVYEYV